MSLVIKIKKGDSIHIGNAVVTVEASTRRGDTCLRIVAPRDIQIRKIEHEIDNIQEYVVRKNR